MPNIYWTSDKKIYTELLQNKYNSWRPRDETDKVAAQNKLSEYWQIWYGVRDEMVCECETFFYQKINK